MRYAIYLLHHSKPCLMQFYDFISLKNCILLVRDMPFIEIITVWNDEHVIKIGDIKNEN